MASLADVRNIAAEMLNRRNPGRAIKSTLKTRLDKSYDYVYADLKDEQLTIWAKAAGTTIPDAVAPHVAALMAFEATNAFGVSNDRFARIVSKASLAKFAIRKNVTPIYDSLDEPEDF